MNFEIDFFLIIFILLLILLTIVSPISGYQSVAKLKKNNSEAKKIKFYRDSIIWLWILVFLVLLIIPLSDTGLHNIGFKWIDLETHSLNQWIVYPTIGFFLFYLSYNIYLIIVFKSNRARRAKASKDIPKDFRIFFPITKKEKRVWSFVAISAGITEEIIYRGYLFYALGMIFPGLSLIYILLITTIIFGTGHIYLGKEAIKSTLLGLIFGIFYIVFDSVFPIIIIHITQDLVVRDLLDEEIENNI